MTLSQSDENTIPVLVQESLIPDTGRLVNGTSYPSLLIFQSCMKWFGWVNQKSQPEIWVRWLTGTVTLYANLEALSE